MRIRGRLLTMNQLMTTVGILVAYLVNRAFAGGACQLVERLD